LIEHYSLRRAIGGNADLLASWLAALPPHLVATHPVLNRLASARPMAPSAPDRSRDLPEQLTERELEVLRQLAKGRQNKEIATELWISERTVKFHVSAILAKLGVGNRTEAVSKAAQLGLVEL
jgi:DNA-binding NarL/FixJ family response regulator